MKVAIYARYSSENQSEKSIDDQVRVCQKYIESNNLQFDEKHVYVDEAMSGSIHNRPGLLALEKAIENKEIQAVAVDDLSRLSRSNHQMLTMVQKFDYYQVKIISVSDGIITDDDNSKLGIHIRGLINELYLDDLKKKTMRGLEGQKLRGYSTGESVYGYKSHPVGELRLNKKGQPKYEGKIHKIHEEEACIVRRIYREFTAGKSICAIAQDLNKEQVPTKRSGDWNTSTLSRILKNEKYTGHWVWRKFKNVRDPVTGNGNSMHGRKKSRSLHLKKSLQLSTKKHGKKPRKDGWKWMALGRWPREAAGQQKSYIHANPMHLLAGLLKCKSCRGAIVQISGKGGGYYGCYNNKRKSCNNKLLIRRTKIESIIINDLKEKFLTAENLKYIYENVEKTIAKTLNEVPEELKQKRHQYDKVQAELQNLLSFIKAGNFSKVVSEALIDAEGRSERLKGEMEGLEYQRKSAFKAPPREWIDFRLEKLHETLDKNTKASALALKDLLGSIELEPVPGECVVENGRLIENRAYYVAHTNIDTLALLEETKGSNWLRCRKR